MSQCEYFIATKGHQCHRDAEIFLIAHWDRYVWDRHVSDEPRDYCAEHGLTRREDWIEFDTKEERDLELLRRSL